jgi:hypothetical protein
MVDTCKTCWTWLRDETNRNIIAWVGSGLVVAASGLWIGYEKLDKGGGEASPAAAVTKTVTIQGKGIVAGRDVNQGVIVGKPADEQNASAQTPSSNTVVIGGDGVVGGRDVNTGSLVFED